MSENSQTNSGGLVRSITWKQGILIALGIPILILPSIFDISGTVWAFGIVIWTLSVIQGFFQNMASAELVTTFPDEGGVPGAVQKIFVSKNVPKYNFKNLAASFGAWNYWIAWTPVPAVFSIMMTEYLVGYFEMFANVNYTALSLTIGAVVIGGFALINARGLKGGASAGFILAMLSILPIVIILGATLVTGDFKFENIQNGWLPPSWTWGPADIVMLFGCFGLAQWSACAWEGLALYGPEYKKPESDVPRALFICGFICLILYFFMSTTVYGTLTISEIEGAGYATLIPIATLIFGDFGGTIAILFLIAAMLLIIQTGLLGGARSLYSLARGGTMPHFFTKVNKNGAPIYALIMAFSINMVLILVGNPISIIAAAGMANILQFATAMIAFFVLRTNKDLMKLPRGWSAPKIWKWIAFVLIFYQLCVLLPCLFYWDFVTYGLLPSVLAIVVITMYIPIWFVMQYFEKNPEENPVEEV